MYFSLVWQRVSRSIHQSLPHNIVQGSSDVTFPYAFSTFLSTFCPFLSLSKKNRSGIWMCQLNEALEKGLMELNVKCFIFKLKNNVRRLAQRQKSGRRSLARITSSQSTGKFVLYSKAALRTIDDDNECYKKKGNTCCWAPFVV